MSDNNTLVLVDGSSYLFRAFFAAPPFATSSGIKTGTLYLFTNMIKSLIKKHPTNRFAVTFDAKGPTFRHKMYPEYKANRPPMPPDLKGQVEIIHSFLKAMGIPIISEPGVEADDILGTISRQASSNGMKVIISTGDKDIAQLVDKNVTIVDTMKDEYLDETGVQEKYGIKPKNIIDFLALKGDKSDNIPGVDGIGDKAAIGLIQAFGGLEDIYNNLDEVPGLSIRGAKRVRSLLEEQKEQAEISYKLATIDVNLELDYTYDLLIKSEEKTQDLAALCEEYELNKWLTELNSEQPTQDEFKLFEAKSISDIEDFVSSISDNQAVSFAYLENESGAIHALSLSKEKQSLFIALNEEGLSQDECAKAIQPIFSDDRTGPIVSELWKESLYALGKLGVKPGGVMVSLSLLSTVKCFQFDNHTLEGIVQREVNSVLPKLDLKKLKMPVSDLVPEHVRDYLVPTSELTYSSLQSILKSSPEALEELIGYKSTPVQELTPLALEHRLESHLYAMEKNGILIDQSAMKELSETFQSKIKQITEQCHIIAGEEFKISSPKEISYILFDHLGIKPVGRKGKSGSYSTKEEVLDKLSSQGYEIAKLISEYRSLSKLVSTYVDKLPKLAEKKSGRVHTTYNQNRTKTGRLSSTDPNLQNIPVKTENGRKIRQAFIARKGWKILALDYSQIELRIMAHLSQDKALIEAFNLDLDIHSMTAASIEGVSLDEVTDSMRRNAKAINFGLIYDISAYGLARDLGITTNEAQSYINAYFLKYPGVARYIKQSKLNARETCKVSTLGGRTFYYPETQSGKHMVQQSALRQALNAPLQGTSAEIIKRAMITCSESFLLEHSDKILMLMQVHDELVFEVKEEFAEEAKLAISKIMSSAQELLVPLKVDANIDDNWSDAH